jgi:serine/threonine protein kinase
VLKSGDIVGTRYAVAERLASGGMGTVYRAQHTLSRREVALKVLYPKASFDALAIERFRREASVAAEISHAGLVEVLDAGFDEALGTPFLVMELLAGEHLGRRLSRERTTVSDALALFDALLDPLAAVHSHGFVHRDLKPENVFVVRDGDGERVKILDFGVAKHMNASSASMTGTALGTPYYMAPEQVLNSKSVTPAADVWSIGVMLFELATGRLPFEGPTPESVLVKTCTQAPPSVSEAAPSIAPALARVIDRCLRMQPEERPADARALRIELARASASEGPFAQTVHLDRFRETPPDVKELEGELDVRTEPRTAPRIGWRVVSGPGWSIEVPPTWLERETMVPHVAASWEAPETIDGVRPRVLIKVEPWPGDSRSYVDLGIENTARAGRIVRSVDASLAGRRALELEVLFQSADPPYRALRRATVINGAGYMVGCDGPVLRFLELVPTFRAIFTSFQVEHAATLA